MRGLRHVEDFSKAADAPPFIGRGDQRWGRDDLPIGGLSNRLDGSAMFDESPQQPNENATHGDGTNAQQCPNLEKADGTNTQQNPGAQQHPTKETVDAPEDGQPEDEWTAVDRGSVEQESSTAGQSSTADQPASAGAASMPGPPYMCDHPGCGQSFSSPAKLRRHRNRNHTPWDELRHICEVCRDQRFYYKKDLERHLGTSLAHTSPRFQCTSCEKKLTRADNRHWASCHGPQGGTFRWI